MPAHQTDNKHNNKAYNSEMTGYITVINIWCRNVTDKDLGQ